LNLQTKSKFKDNLGLYVITTESKERSHIDVAKAAIEAGISIIQYRDKNSSSKILFERAKELRKLTESSDALLIINDRIDIAIAINADGVHLGQDDIYLDVARKILGYDYIIGISATSYDEAIAASKSGADYIGLGPIFPTPSKVDAAPPIGIEGLVEVRQDVKIPIVAIGGITAENIEGVVLAGADGIAVISAVASAPNMVEAAKLLKQKINHAKALGN